MPAKYSVLGWKKGKASPHGKEDRRDADRPKRSCQECTTKEIKGAVRLINHLGKACFIHGLHNERIQTIVRSRGVHFLISSHRNFAR
jgi:hypothetical protein